MATLLIVDDEEAVTRTLATFFERSGGHRVVRAHTGREGIDLFEQLRPDVVLLDLWLPDMSGLDVLAAIRGDDPVVVMITGSADVEMAVAAMRNGAENFLAKPLELPHLAVVVDHAIEKARLRRLSLHLSARRGEAARRLLGNSPSMRELTEQIDVLAATDRTTVLLLGESGSGKGRVAEYIHAHGPRARQPFIEVNCAALSAAALDSELFGHERNAAAHVDESKPGLFEVADGGTLFLDEIGELAPELQPKLLRVLEGKSFRRLGGTQEILANVRLIAATTRDLVTEVMAGHFREDLYYRLGVMPIVLPPLRARSENDMLEIIGSVLDELRAQLPDAPHLLGDVARERMLAYAWPGNLRELRNVLERAMLVGRGVQRIEAEHLPPEVRGTSTAEPGPVAAPHEARSLADVERAHIAETLLALDGNRTHAARELGISRATLIKKIREFGLGPRRDPATAVPTVAGTRARSAASRTIGSPPHRTPP